jgi:hypothetical protein
MSLKTLEKITNDLIPKYPSSTEWDNSPFNWIRALPPASKGAIGRDIGSGLLFAYGFTPGAYKYELRVNGQGVLVRVAMKWKGNIVKFQNIRDITFDHVLCIAIYPKGAYAWLIPRGEIWRDNAVRTDHPEITRQHKGADAWMSIDPKNPPAWMKPYGGTIEEMIKVAKRVFNT